MFKGSIVALITPFKNGKIDEVKFQALVEWQISQGTQGLVPCGTTGESPTLSHEEHNRVVDLCVEAAAAKVPVIAGTGSNSTDEAIALTRHAEAAGAAAALVVTPYYNKPTQEGLYHHYKTLAESTRLPIIIYNIPGRSVVDMSVDTMARLAKIPNIVGVKDATQDLARPIRTRLACGPDFCQLSGEDGTAVPFLGAGGQGCISVTANVAPKLCAEVHAVWAKGDTRLAIERHDRLMPLHDAMFCETSPGPVKYAASLLGLCSAETRLPLCEISQRSKDVVKAALGKLGLI
ncbi:MAG: 4-hydroxy-tetrahydrodipicolinate synthase [Proteobacteria bacterium]|nr:4-hydroxy-tetrahydrodipicolinate synthase [Pseudomonadota bacterium]